MTWADAHEYLDELEALEARGGSQAEVAARLEQRAEQSEPGSSEYSGFLDAAGDFWGYAGEPGRAESAYRASIASGGDTSRYAEAALVLLLLGEGREEDADVVLAGLLRSARADELDAATYEMVGDSLEEAGRLREALRWYTMPIRDVDLDDLDRADLGLLHGRHRVREALGLGEDRFDLARDRIMAELPGRDVDED